jgi:hypothetical protein
VLGYEELITRMFANPFQTQRQLAADTGYSEAWLSRLISSDLFQSRLRERREKELDPAAQAAVAARFGSIRDRSLASLSRTLELVERQLDRADADPDLQSVLKTGEFLSKLAGYGARDAGGASVQVNMSVHLQELAGNMVSLFRAARADTQPASSAGDKLPHIEGECHEHQPIPAPPGADAAPPESGN